MKANRLLVVHAGEMYCFIGAATAQLDRASALCVSVADDVRVVINNSVDRIQVLSTDAPLVAFQASHCSFNPQFILV